MTDTRPTIKLPLEVYELLKSHANLNHRTIAGQIAAMLEATKNKE